VKTVLGALAAEGVPMEALARTRAPIGLDLGGQTPGEVSLSILAQIIAERHGKVEALGTSVLSIAAPVMTGGGRDAPAADDTTPAETAAATAQALADATPHQDADPADLEHGRVG